MTAPKPLTYRDANIPKKDKQICPKCVGNGEIKCPHCGYVHTCETCEGEGLLLNGQAPLTVYTDQVIRESELYKQWMESIGAAERAIESELTQ